MYHWKTFTIFSESVEFIVKVVCNCFESVVYCLAHQLANSAVILTKGHHLIIVM